MARVTSLLVLFALGSCSESSTTVEPSPVPRSSRTVAVDIGAAAGETYEQALDAAWTLGVDEVKLSLDWNQLETAGGFDFTLLDIADSFYPAKGVPLTLVLRPINTNRTTLPADLTGAGFDSPVVRSRFEALLTAMHARLSRTQLVRVLVGNEVGGVLGGDAAAWAAFTGFVEVARSRIRALWGEVPVGSIVQWHILTSASHAAAVGALNAVTDFVAVNYYPLEGDFSMRPTTDVAGDFQAVVDLFPGRDIVFQECGYASDPFCQSSEAQQEAFIAAVFAAWDTHAAAIRHIDFAWQTDVPSSTVAGWVVEYGMQGQPNEARFAAYLGSLGMRRSTGEAKPAWNRLTLELARRGWAPRSQ